MEQEIDLDLLRTQELPLQLGALLLRQRPDPDLPIVWVDISARPDLNRLRPEFPTEHHLFISLFYDPDQRDAYLRVDLRPGHHIFTLRLPLDPSPQDTPIVKLILLHGTLLVAPGPPPTDVSGRGLMAHLASAENRGLTLTLPEQTLAGLRRLIEQEGG